MNLLPPTIIRHPCSDLDQALDQPLHGTFGLFAEEVELIEHLQEAVGQDPHEQLGLVGGESVSTRVAVDFPRPVSEG